MECFCILVVDCIEGRKTDGSKEWILVRVVEMQ